MRLRSIINEDDNVIPFKARDREKSSDAASGGEVVSFPKKSPPAQPPAENEPEPDVNPDPNHWYDIPKFEKNLWKVARQTNNPHWWELQAKTMMSVLTKNLGHPDTIKLLWSGQVPFEIVKLIQLCMKRLPDGTRDGRANPKYKPSKAKAPASKK